MASDIKFKIGAIEKITNVLKKVENRFPKISRAVARTTLHFKAFQQQTKGVRNALSRLGNGAKSLGQSMLMTTTLPITGAFGFAIKKSMDFQSSMNKVKALTKAGADEMESMKTLAKKLGSETQFSASQAADAMGFLGMAGWETSQILEGVPGILSLAAASNIELGRAADIASNIMGAFGIDASNASKVADILATTTSSANVDMEMLADTMKFAGPVAKQYGLSLEETAAAAGVLGNVGIQGTLAGTGLKNLMLGLSTGGSAAQKIMAKLGASVNDSEGNLRSITSIMKDLGANMKGLPKAEQLNIFKTLFGKIGISSAASFADSIESMTILTGKLTNDNVVGSAKKMADTINSGAKGAITQLQSAIEGLSIAFTDSGILDGFTFLIKKITDLVRWMSTFSPTTMKIIGILGVLAAAIGPVLFAFGAVSSILPVLISGFGLLLSVFAGFSTVAAVVFAPIPLIIAGVGLAIAGLIVYWDDLMNAMSSLASWIGDTFMSIFEWLDQKITKITSGISSFRSIASFFKGEDDIGANGVTTGAAAIQQTITERRESNSRLSVGFENLPQGATVEPEGTMTGIDFSMGFVGGMV